MSRRSWIWTAEFRALVQADVDRGQSRVEVAVAYGMTVQKLKRARARGLIVLPGRPLGEWRRPVVVEVELIDRACLACGKAFKAMGKTQRLCDECRAKASRSCGHG